MPPFLGESQKILCNNGFQEAYTTLCKYLPKKHNTRLGNFGEVIAAEHLRQRYGCKILVYKLRFAESRDLPTRGEDIIVFRLQIDEKKIKCICLGEAKTSKKFSHTQVKNAYERLQLAYHPEPVTLSLIANILYTQNNTELADQITDIIQFFSKKDFPTENWIFIISETSHTDPFIEIQNNSQVLDNLFCVNLHLTKLIDFVNELFGYNSDTEN